MNILKIGADLAEIATAVVAVLAYGRYLLADRQKRKALENYLKAERPGKRGEDDPGARTVLHLVADLRMSEEDILRAAFGNPRILATTEADKETGRAAALYLRYKPPGPN